MKIREKSKLFQDYIRKAKGNVDTFDALEFPKKKQIFEAALKFVSRDMQKCGATDKKYVDLYRLKFEFETELSSLIENVKSSGPSNMMSEGSRSTAGELNDSRERNSLRRKE